MFDVSDEFRAAVVGSHTMAETVQVVDHDGTVLADLDVVGGDVTEDAGAVVRHSTDLTVLDATGDLTPTDLDDLLMPVGARVLVSRGIVFDDSTVEAVPLITAWLSTSGAGFDAAGRATIPVTGFDRMSRLQRPTPRPVVVAASQAYPDAIVDLLRTTDPGLDAEPMTSEWVTPTLVFDTETDLTDEAVKMATAIGAEVFITREDVLVVRPVPVRTNPAVWTIHDGSDRTRVTGSVADAAEVAWSTDQRPNGVIVVGQHSSMANPVRGEAWDDTSPARRNGPLGPNPLFVSTEKATTTTQANAMARAILDRKAGVQEIDLEVFPPPVHLLTGDVVNVELPTMGVAGRFILDRMVTPLGDPSGAAQITVRAGVVDDAVVEA